MISVADLRFRYPEGEFELSVPEFELLEYLTVLDILLEAADATGATLVTVTHDHDLLPKFDRHIDVMGLLSRTGCLWIAMAVLVHLVCGCYPTGTTATSNPITMKSTTNGTST